MAKDRKSKVAEVMNDGPTITKVNPIRPPAASKANHLPPTGLKKADLPPARLKKVEPCNEFNLDQNGETCWIYPGSDGKYEFPQERLETPERAQSSISVHDDFDNIFNEFPSMVSEKDIDIIPQYNEVSERNKKIFNHAYSSNIANIVMNSNVLSSPRIHEDNYKQSSNKSRLDRKSGV